MSSASTQSTMFALCSSVGLARSRHTPTPTLGASGNRREGAGADEATVLAKLVRSHRCEDTHFTGGDGVVRSHALDAVRLSKRNMLAKWQE